MVHTLLCEKALDTQLSYLWSQPTPFLSGFVLGQSVGHGSVSGSHGQDLVVHLAPTPAPAEDPITSVELMDVTWMLEHHKQISRMLPGGINVLGAFFVDSSDLFQSSMGMTHIRKLLKVVAAKEGLEGKDFAVLHFDKRSKKVSAKLLDTSPNAGHTLKAAEFKLDQDFGKWQKVQGTFLLDVPVVFEEKATSELLQDKIEMALKPLERCVKSAVILLDGSFRAEEELLDPAQQDVKQSKTSKKGKARVQDVDEDEDDDERKLKNYRADILLQEDVGDSTDCEIVDMHSRMKLSGKLHLCAFLHGRATVGEALQAVKADLMRSLRGRLQMHCDSLIGDETKGAEEKEVPVLHEPPRRILVKLPSSEVCISDYLYPGETPYDSNDSVEEIFGFKPRIEDMDDELEIVAAPRETAGSESGEESRTSSPGLDSAMVSARCSPVFLVGCIGATLVAVILGYLSIFQFSNSPSDEQGGNESGQHPEL